MTATSTTPSLDALTALLAAANQSHLLTFYPTLPPTEQTALLSQLSSIDVHRVNRIFQLALSTELAASTASSSIQPLPPTASTSSPPPSSPQESALSTLGLSAIASNSVAVLLMAGGQGTRLGSPLPKGMYDIGLPSGKSLFELQAQRIRKLQEVSGGGRIPWYVMTSGPTRAETERFFEGKGYFGLRKEDVVFFEQGVLPALTNDGKILLSTPSTLALSPDGNGGLYAALRKPLSSSPGALSPLADMRARGIKYVHTYGVDNCLVKVADPVFLGLCISRGAEVGAKVVKKTRAEESVGVVAVKDGKFGVVEYSELSKAKSEERDPVSGELVYRAANIVNHFYTLSFLESVEKMEESMAFHIARKKIPTVDLTTGAPITPSSPNGLKMEQFVFDVFPFTPTLTVFEVPRAAEFSPLKNAPGTGTDDPQTSRRDLLALQRRWLEAVGCEVGDGVEVELAPGVSYAGEGLEAVGGKRVVKSGAVESVEELLALCE